MEDVLLSEVVRWAGVLTIMNIEMINKKSYGMLFDVLVMKISKNGFFRMTKFNVYCAMRRTNDALMIVPYRVVLYDFMWLYPEILDRLLMADCCDDRLCVIDFSWDINGMTFISSDVRTWYERNRNVCVSKKPSMDLIRFIRVIQSRSIDDVSDIHIIKYVGVNHIIGTRPRFIKKCLDYGIFITLPHVHSKVWDKFHEDVRRVRKLMNS